MYKSWSVGFPAWKKGCCSLFIFPSASIPALVTQMTGFGAGLLNQAVLTVSVYDTFGISSELK